MKKQCVILALAMTGLFLCAGASAGSLQGEAFYRERIALPPEAVFEVVLLDVSRDDASAEALGRARLEPAGRSPFHFEIPYSDAAIRPEGRYAVRATVTIGGRIYFTTDRDYLAFKGGDRPLRLLLVRARVGSGQPLPPASSESGRFVNSPLRNTYWKLTYLSDIPAQRAERQREAHLIFADNDMRVFGSGGCNRISGSFELNGDRLRLGRMAGTMMACRDGMGQEQRFLQSLTKVERYRVSGGHLELLDSSGAVLAQFEAVALR